MRKLALIVFQLAWLVSPSIYSATINVTTNLDEFTCNGEVGCGDCVAGPGVTCTNNSGCSLREAMYNVTQGNNTSFPQCTAPDTAGPNTIDLTNAGGEIVINGAVFDPTNSNNPDVHNGSLESNANVVDSNVHGALTVENGSISCFTDPSTHVGGRMFHLNAGADLTLSKVTMENCEDTSPGIAVRTDSGTGSAPPPGNPTTLTINNSAFNLIHSTDGAHGGCILHGDGNLTINDSAFTSCQIDDSNQTSGAHDASGGAISMGTVGFGTVAQIYNTAFTTNSAKTNGGAIEFSSTDTALLVNTTFTGNTANGNTNSSGNAEQGGGAIYASQTENSGQVTSSFLVINSFFTLNSAPNGTGGAILVSQGNLTYGASLLAAPGAIGIGNGSPATPPYPTNIPGGIFSTNFFSNSAGGTWNGTPVDTRAGAGGAIYASGNLAILDSSVLSNSSTNGSGGGVAVYGSSSFFSAGNTTFNGNSASVNGGAIANLRNSTQNFNPTMKLTNDTVSGDSAGSNGGGEIYNGGAAADVTVSNSILANSTGGGNCAPANGITDSAGNLQFGSGTDCGAAMRVGDPQLSAPAPFGGVNFQVAVMTLGSASVASKNGDPATCTGQPVYDLDAALNTRPSPNATNCDIGAYESSELTPVRLQSFEVD